MIHGKKIGAVIAAGGSGKRMGTTTSKQLLSLDGESILFRTLKVFQESKEVDIVVISAHEKDIASIKKIVDTNKLSKVISVVSGGSQRQDSVWNGLQALKESNIDVVLVHDAVRPFINQEMICSVAKAAIEHGAAVVAVRPKDTIKVSAGNGFAERTLEREKAWIVQTPQAFEFNLLWTAFEKAMRDRFYGTDDASLVEQLGKTIKIVEGNYSNIKITTPEDLAFAEAISREFQNHTGGS